MWELEVSSPTEYGSHILKNEQPDLKVSIGNISFFTSKFLSASTSIKINEALTQNQNLNKDENQSEIKFENINVDQETVRTLLDFFNGKTITINEKNFENMLSIASTLEIPALLEQSFFLAEAIDIRNLLFSENSRIPEKVITDIIASVFDLFSTCDDLLQKPPYFVRLILLSKKLVVQSEDFLCEWIFRYHNTNYDLHTESLFLFNYVLAQNLSEEYCAKLSEINDIHALLIIMEKRLTYDPKNDEYKTQSNRYQKRTNIELLTELTQYFSLVPINDD